MDCQTCESMLLDLAYGELSSSAVTEARVHLSRCAQCNSALSRIESGLAFARRMPMMEPPSALSDRLMHAARRQVLMPSPVTRVSPFQKWSELLLRFAMTRQVQMATVMLVIVVMGLWSVPQLSRKREAQGGTVINPENGGEAGPSAALSPATPLDLAVDPRTGRIRSKGEMHEFVARSRDQAKASQEGSATVAEAVPGQMEAPAPSPVASPSAEINDELSLHDGFANNAPAESEKAKLDESARADMAAPEDDKAQNAEAFEAQVEGRALKKERSVRQEFAQAPPTAARRATKPSAPSAAPSKGVANMATDELVTNPYQSSGSGSGLGSLGGSSYPKEQKVVSRAMPKTIAASKPNAPSGTFSQAMERYRAADYGTARSIFEGLLARGEAAAQTASVLLYLARSERAQGRCDLAAAHYETVALRHSNTSEAASALAEGVGCYDQLGQRSRADNLLVKAARVPVPVLAARAKQTLGERGATAPAPRNQAPATTSPAASPILGDDKK